MHAVREMAQQWKTFSQWFWDDNKWFPPGITWSSLEPPHFEGYPNIADLRFPIYYAFVIIVIRFFFEWLIARPFGRFCGIKDTYSELPKWIKKLLYLIRSEPKAAANGHAPNGEVKGRKRRPAPGSKHVPIVSRKSTLDKFSECCWRGTYYFGIFVYGMYILWDKPWFWDTAHCWYGYPYQNISKDIWWYYMVEAGFYWSLTISQFVDVQRKDFWVNFIHHIATIVLIYFSWADNFVRVGSLVLVVHDAVDFWLEIAKMCRYCNRVTMCNILFGIFILLWFITRLGIFPFRVIYSTLVEAPSLISFYAAYYTFNFLLLLLQVLHIFWSIMIIRIVYIAVTSGQTDDVRSDDEDEDDDKED